MLTPPSIEHILSMKQGLKNRLEAFGLGGSVHLKINCQIIVTTHNQSTLPDLIDFAEKSLQKAKLMGIRRVKVNQCI